MFFKCLGNNAFQCTSIFCDFFFCFILSSLCSLNAEERGMEARGSVTLPQCPM